MLSLCYPCSGKDAYGMMKDMEENPKNWEGRKVLFLHTGGLLGLFDKGDQMSSLVGNSTVSSILYLF
jgi:1-aminocyclopropane-1-carboxylate deaminase/D-cysteine desulfhydrase-like pyridoxal-dependent ACC family enzyme